MPLRPEPRLAVARAQTQPSAPRDRLTWGLLGLGVAAIALGAWDVVVERDGSTLASLVMMTIGGLVVALGLARRRAGQPN